MRRDGLDARTKIGVRQMDGQLRSHAWVELEDRPIAEAIEELAHFRVIEIY
jgi:hypothetical protein